MAKNRHPSSSPAFTIVELLIVIVVIGILAAIVIVAFNGIQKQAGDAAVRSDLTQMAKMLEIYKAKNGRYPTSATELADADIRLNRSNYMLTQPDGVTARNNLYYYISTASHPRGYAQLYAVGTTPKNALSDNICIQDGAVVAASCNSQSGTQTLISSSGVERQYISMGYDTSLGGWQAWTQ